MRHFLVIFSVLSLWVSPLLAQDDPPVITQSVQGVVVDDATGRPLEGAKVVLKDSVAQERAFTDGQGVFKIDKAKIGRYLLDVSAAGYEEYLLPDLLVSGGKQVIMEIRLIQTGGSMDSVIISTDRTRQLAGLSTRIFTVDETRRFAATYFDPARLVTSYPGVAGVNDQANHLSIRGNSPNAMSWRLEGVDIVNPNHLTNAGTQSDRPSLNGGGVNIISTQMMATSSFKNGAFDATYGNTLSGVMDMNLRRGNPSKDEYIFQFGLTGLDVAAEGPIGTNGKDAFVGNLRYSTVGLLTSLGVDFGDEKINFWDASFNASFVNPKAGTFTVFGMYGKSNNLFEGTHVDSLREFEKDAFDIEYKGRMGAIGMTHTLVAGSRLLFKTVVATSSTSQKRFENFIADSLSRPPVAQDELGETRLSLTTSATYQLAPGQSLQLGGYATFFWYNLNNRYGPPGELGLLASADGKTSLFQPYIRWRGYITPNLSLDLGAHAMYLSLNGDFVVEPRASVRYQISPKQSISLAFGWHSRMQPFNMYFTPTDSTEDQISYINQNLGFTRAQHAVLSYAYRFSESFSVKVEPYYQYLFNVPIVNRPSSNFSALNLFEGVLTDTLENAGTGTNYGVEVSVEKTLARNFYFLVSGAYYQSTYVGGDTVERNTRYNGNYLGSVTAGYEWDLSKKKEPKELEEETEKQKKKRAKKEEKALKKAARNKGKPKPVKQRQSLLGVDARFVYQGGYRTTPIDTLASEIANMTLYKNSEAWSQQLPDFMRLDLRLSWTRHKPNYTRTLSIDIQNALNQQNLAWQYYDRQKQQVVSKYQLGIIPLLTYRIEF